MPRDSMGVITLQYPDLCNGKLRILASTRHRKALLAFREAVLVEARLKLMNFPDDEVLRIEYKKDYERLRGILDLLIPVNDETEEQAHDESQD